MLPYARIEPAVQDLDANLAQVLLVARDFNLNQPLEGVHDCLRYADVAFVLEVDENDPLGWRYCALSGSERLNGAAKVVSRLGELPDPKFTAGVLIPTYLDAVTADGPVAHRIVAIANNTFVAYHKLTIPIRATSRSKRVNHILSCTVVELAIRLAQPPDVGSGLTPRERACLALAGSGLLAKQIAVEVGISDKTVELHLSQARRKLGARTTSHAVAISMALAMLG